jgi:hypothetical protein
VVHDDCSYVRGDWCYRERTTYYGDSIVGLGLSVGVVGGLFDADLNGLSGSRVTGNDVSAGVLPDVGGDFRMWLTWGRARFGGMIQTGWVQPPAGDVTIEGGVFEEGSWLDAGWFLGVWGIGAYQPHLSDLVQLWLGARAGFHLLELGVVSNGRRYASVARPAFSAGPEIGVRLSADLVGVMLQGFADLAQPGHGQLVLSFVYEEPKPPGAAW